MPGLVQDEPGPGSYLGGQWCDKDQKDIPTSRRFFPRRWKQFHCSHCLFLLLCGSEVSRAACSPSGRLSVVCSKRGAWTKSEGQKRGQQRWDAEEGAGGMEVLEVRPKLRLSPIATGLHVPTCHFCVSFFFNRIN